VRRIDEVTRGVTARDKYEKISRNVRYELYRKAISECVNKGRNEKSCGVFLGENRNVIKKVGIHEIFLRLIIHILFRLGHHRGDLIENVLSNSHKGKGPLDLSGMASVGLNDGVTIYRPFLSLEKVQIFDYSHTFGVPYFRDTVSISEIFNDVL
jgi:tRNA(Ile)-lysidine synthase TilS/MesJ